MTRLRLVAFIVCTCMPSVVFPARDLTELVLQRFYYVQRLERVITILKELEHTVLQAATAKKLTPALFPEFVHPLVHEAVSSFLAYRRLAAVMTIWETLRAYRYLEDEELVREFCHAVLIITHTLMSSHDDRTLSCLGKQTLRSGEPSAALIAERFYLIQRLSRAIRLCELVDRLSPAPNPTMPVSDEIVGSVLDELWRDFTAYVCIDDRSCTYRLCTYLLHALSQYGHNSGIIVPAFSEQTSLGTLEEVLDQIDSITDALEPVFKQYMIDKRHWWQVAWERIRLWLADTLDHSRSGPLSHFLENLVY